MGCETDVVAAASEVRALSAVVTKVARRDLEERLGRGGVGVRAVEHGVLRHLADGDRTLAYLSRVMMLVPSTLVSVIDGLEEKGLLRRGTDPKDRRRSPLTLTGEGEELVARAAEMDGDGALVRALAAMGEERGRELLALMRSFVGHLTDEGDPIKGSHLPKSEVEEAPRVRP